MENTEARQVALAAIAESTSTGKLVTLAANNEQEHYRLNDNLRLVAIAEGGGHNYEGQCWSGAGAMWNVRVVRE